MVNEKLIRNLAWFFIVVALATMVFGIEGTNIVSQVREFTISHPNAPEITYVQSLTRSPSEGQNITAYIAFNVTDADGRQNLDDDTALVTITKLDVQRNSASCEVTNVSSTMKQYNCSLQVAYYDYAGIWEINASITDINNNSDYNNTQSFTYQELTAFVIDLNALTFGSIGAGVTDQGATNNPIGLNNTGNMNITEINITGYDLEGVTDSSYFIGAGNFTINVSDSAIGKRIINATSFTISDALLPKATDTGETIEDLYVYVDVPTGLIAQDYNATKEWQIDVS